MIIPDTDQVVILISLTGDMNKRDNYYNDAPLRTTLEELQEFASKSKVEKLLLCASTFIHPTGSHHLRLATVNASHYRCLDWQRTERCHAVG